MPESKLLPVRIDGLNPRRRLSTLEKIGKRFLCFWKEPVIACIF